ncbi:hypothetical protein ACFE04_031682 [Oxalis oulophora]
MFLSGFRRTIAEMGYSMSRLDLESEPSDSSVDYGAIHELVGDNSKRSTDVKNILLDQDIAQLTKLTTAPDHHFSPLIPATKQDLHVSPVKMLAGREANLSGKGRFSSADRCHMLSRYLPVKGPWLVDQMISRAYISQFSYDGSLLVAGFQGSHIKVYNVDKGLKIQKDILAKNMRWTVTDTCLSPNQRCLVYASMSPVVQIVDVGSSTTESHANVNEIHEGLDFSEGDSGARYSFGIFSIKFSNDSREIVAGTSNDSIYVYDLEALKPSLKIRAHTSDVNTVCFADESSHLIYSGSDDDLCKVWDRRCLTSAGKPAGILLGHLEGVTFIDSRGDGRYFISNGKDQSIKLWDIRKMASSLKSNLVYRNYEWDYRWMDYPPPTSNLIHPGDQSVATYRGHSVLRTLIRCYFSPSYSTGQKYIYTGSHDSSVYVYDVLTGEKVAVLKHHNSPVRDCSWHPYYPMLVSSSWDGDVVKWEFPGNGQSPVPATPKRIRRRHFF